MRLEYELLKRSILERNRRTYLAISIIVPASLLAILECFISVNELRAEVVLVQSVDLLVVFSVSIGEVILSAVLMMLICLLIIQWSAIRTNRVEYDVMNEIVKSLGEEGFPMSKAYEERLKGKIWFEIRNYLWSLIVVALIAGNLLAILTFP